jgi:hypothetical protein
VGASAGYHHRTGVKIDPYLLDPGHGTRGSIYAGFAMLAGHVIDKDQV